MQFPLARFALVLTVLLVQVGPTTAGVARADPPIDIQIEPLPPPPPPDPPGLGVEDGPLEALPVTPNTTEVSGHQRKEPLAPLVFCSGQTDCAPGSACVAGSCLSLRDSEARLLFPIAIDRVVDRETGRRNGAISDRVDELLRRCLTLSGFFQVLFPQANPRYASLEGMSETTIDHQAWLFAGAYAVVKGELTREAEGHILTLRLAIVEEARLYALPHDRQILPDDSPATIKLAVTRWIDDLVTAFSGKGGVFSTRVAFAKRMQKGGPKEIGVMDMDGENEVMLTANGSINLLPGWNRRGKITWTSFKDNNPDLYVGGVKFSARPRMNSGAAYSPDGMTVALTLSMDGQAEIYLLDAATGDVKRNVTRHKAIDTSPTWSPDGRQIAFATDRFSGYPMLAVTDPEGIDVSILPQIGGYNAAPDWSPTGDEIAYTTLVGGERYQIIAINMASRTVRRLTSVGSNEEPSYSPDGRYIVFSSTRDGQTGVWMMTADGDNQRQISRGTGSYFAPAWER